MKRLIYTCLVILTLASLDFAQAAKTAPNDARELWLVRSQTLTSDLLKDGADLSSLQRAVLWVKLAQRWWREDPKRARSWIASAIEVVEQVPNKETPEEREERLDTVRTLLTIVTPLDQKLAKRLLNIFTVDSKSSENERAGAADALIDAAVSILTEDPKRAAELGALALRTGRPYNLSQFLFGLRARDPKLADALFMQALGIAKQDPRGSLLNPLTHIAFPAQRGHGDQLAPPQPLQVELLLILVSPIINNPASGENQTCGTVIWLTPLFSEIERLLPQQWPVVRQTINQCRSSAPPLDQQQLEEATRSQPLDTVEALLKAATDANETSIRTNYEYRAATLANEHRNYELALKILDSMSKEQRESLNDSWTLPRWDWAADGALDHYLHGRFREMNLMLEAVPSDLQPLAKAAFIGRLPARVDSETAPIIQILNDAITGLRRSSMPGANKYEWYFALLRATIKYQPADANAVLKDAVASLNEVKDGQPLNANEAFRTFGPALVEMDEFIVKDALASVTLVQTRAQLRLVLLNATLQRVSNNSRN